MTWLIIGPGPAGDTVAIYACARTVGKRWCRKASSWWRIHHDAPGGELPWLPLMASRARETLMDEMREQALRFGADLRMEDVDAASSTGRSRRSPSAMNMIEPARATAMGAAARHLGVPGEDALLGMAWQHLRDVRRVFFATRTSSWSAAAILRWKEAILFLTSRFSHLVDRRDEFVLADHANRAGVNEKIASSTNTWVLEGQGSPKVSGARSRNNVTGEESKLWSPAVFVAMVIILARIWRAVKVDLDADGDLTQPGLDAPRSRCLRRRRSADQTYREVVTAAGSGRPASIHA